MPEANEAAADIEEVQAWAVGLDALHARIAPRFARAEPRRRVLAYIFPKSGQKRQYPLLSTRAVPGPRGASRGWTARGRVREAPGEWS